MSKGDTINLNEPLFIHGEACTVAGIDGKSLNNWTQREIISLGQMHRSGRRLYSILDLVKLRVIADLARILKMGPSFAEAISQSVMPRAGEVFAALAKGKFREAKDEAQFLLAWAEPETDKFSVVRTKAGRLQEAIPESHPAIIVPIDVIVREVTGKALIILHNERIGA